MFNKNSLYLISLIYNTLLDSRSNYFKIEAFWLTLSNVIEYY